MNPLWGAEEYLADLNVKSLPMESQAFHRITLLPVNIEENNNW